jgi:hypothetical protein
MMLWWRTQTMPWSRTVLLAAAEPARAALGQQEFDAAWAAGRAMSLNQAIAYALEEPAPSTEA